VAEPGAVPPGRYRHFKGDEYEVVAVARHSESEAVLVVYHPAGQPDDLWVRPIAMWNEPKETAAGLVPRFRRVP